MKCPCYQHDSYHAECSSCRELNGVSESVVRHGTRHKPLRFTCGEEAMSLCKRTGMKVWARINGSIYEMYPGGRIINWGKPKKVSR